MSRAFSHSFPAHTLLQRLLHQVLLELLRQLVAQCRPLGLEVVLQPLPVHGAGCVLKQQQQQGGGAAASQKKPSHYSSGPPSLLPATSQHCLASPSHHARHLPPAPLLPTTPMASESAWLPLGA